MAGNSPTQLPAYIQLRYEENGVFAKMTGAAEDAAAKTQSAFTRTFAETEKMVSGAVGRISSKFAKLDLGVGDLRQQSVQIKQYRDALELVASTADQLARETGDTTKATQTYITALKSQAMEAGRVLQANEAQITSYARLQAAIDRAAGSRGPDTRSGVQRLIAGDASIDRAALSGRTLEQVLGRVASKGKEVTTALQEAARAAAMAAQNAAPVMANAAPTNTLTGANALVAGQASLDRAAISGTTLEQVLGRVATKSAQVTQAQEQMAASAARAAKEQSDLATAVDRMNAELDPAFAATQRLTQQEKLLAEALDRGAISGERHKQMLELVRNASYDGTTATKSVINSQRSLNVAMLQSGQQLQDIGVSLYSGQKAAVVFAQQLPQLAFALSGLEGSANKTHDRIGRFATFLSGPWGLAVGVAVGALGYLIAKLLDYGDASDEAASKSFDFSQGLDVLTLSADRSKKAMEQLNAEIRGAIAAQGDFLRQKANIANQSVADLENRIAANTKSLRDEQDKASGARGVLGAGILGVGPNQVQVYYLQQQIAADKAALAQAKLAQTGARVAVTQSSVIESLDASAAATGKYNRAVGELNAAFEKGANDPLSGMTDAEYEKRFKQITQIRDAELKAAADAKKKPKKEREDHSAERAARAAKRLADFGDSAAESIQRINEQFSEQPRLVTQTEQATRRLDAIIKDLMERKPIGFQTMIDAAEEAKVVVEDALLRPFQQLTLDSERRVKIQGLIARGREDEADALQTIWQMEERLGPLSDKQKQNITDIVTSEKERTRELQRQEAIFRAQLDVLDTARNSLTDILSGRSSNFLKDVGQSLKDLQGKKLFDSFFGDVFRDLENELRGQSPLGKESQHLADELSVATAAVSKFAAGLSAANDNPVLTAGSSEFNSAFAGLLSGQLGAAPAVGDGTDGGDIVVTAKKPFSIDTRSIQNMADKISKATVAPLEKALSDAFGTKFGAMMSGVLQGALSGYLTGGATGGVLGGLKGLVDKTGIFGGSSGGLSGALGTAGSGAAMGTQAAGIMKSLGLKTSATGAQIGGAIGSFIPIPGGDIIGSIAGGLLGGLFKTNRTAGATVTNSGTVVAGKDKGNYSTATGLGDSVTSGLKNIVDQLGGTLGKFSVTIGTRGDSYRVNTTGTSLKIKNGAVDFGDDQEAAIRYAIMDAINDGAVQGIRESTKRLLKAGDDLDQALQDALDWENVFKELKRYKDPIGAALDDLNDEFEHYIELAKTAGASTQEMADLEELYGIKRNEIIKEQAEQLIGSLQDLYDNLTIGDSGLSLRDRQANALVDYNALAARVAAGDTTAYDDYADSAQTLLDIERELYGSQQEYFDRLNEITSLTKAQIDAQKGVISGAEDSDSPFDSTGAVKSSVDAQTQVLTSQLTAVNDNLGLIQQAIAALGVTGTGQLARIAFNGAF